MFFCITTVLALLIIFAVACGSDSQPPATNTPAPDPVVSATKSVDAWMGDNSSLLLSIIATELSEMGPASETVPGTVNPYLELIKAADIEGQLSDSIEWEVGLGRAGQGHYNVTVIGRGKFVVEVPIAANLTFHVQAIGELKVDANTLAVVDYRVDGLSMGGS